MATSLTTISFDAGASGAALTSEWARIGSFDNTRRGFQGKLTSGDTIKLQFTNEDLALNDKVPMTLPNTAALPANATYAETDVYSTLQFFATYNGQFKWVRAIKTGTAGAAKIMIEG